MATFQEGASIWYGPEVVKNEGQWLFTLTSVELDELILAAEKLAEWSTSENFISLEHLQNLDDFQLSNIKAKVANFIDRLHNGLGFVVWRGFPVETLSPKLVVAAFLIIGKCMGNLRQQNAQGHILGHVKDMGLSSSDPNVRVYQTRERQTFHTDSCDIVGLLCLKPAKSGGLTSLVSSGTIYNEIMKIDAALAEELLLPVPTDKRGEVSEGSLPYFNIPVYSHHEGFLSAIYQRQYIDSAQRFPSAPKLTRSQVDALNLLDSLADDPRLNFTMQFQPGDMQFVHNHSLLHDRTAFEDWTETDQKRHLLRIWIATPNARPLPPVFAERFGTVTVGNRGGVSIPGVAPIAQIHM